MVKDMDIKIGGSDGVILEDHTFEHYLPKLSDRVIPYKDHVQQCLDGQMSQRPKEVIFCKKCVVSNQRPRVTFDKSGICSACNYAEYKKNSVNWKDRKEQFEILLDKYRRKDGRWDCVVPSSGGKDSGSLAHKLKYEYGMHPLSVTWSPLLYTKVGVQNIQNLISSGIDNYMCSPNRMLQRKLARLFFVVQGDHFQPFPRGTRSWPLHVALKEDIKLVMFGENAELEYGGDTKNRDIPYNPIGDWPTIYYRDVGFEKILDFGIRNGYLDESDRADPSLHFYGFPPADKIKQAGIESRWYGWYFNWIPQENYYYATEHYHFQSLHRRSESTYSKYASLDDLTDPLHYYMMLIKFGIGRATSDAAHEIRDGHLTREEGVALVRRYDQEFPEKYFKDFLQYVDMTEEGFWGVVEAYRALSPNLWDKIDGEWKLRHQIS